MPPPPSGQPPTTDEVLPETAPQKRGRPARTDRASVVATARQIVVDEGLEALTMRRLGAVLGMDPMVPYRFFGTKDDLLEAIFKDLLHEIRVAPGDDPIAAVAEGFLQFRNLLVDVPNLFALVAPRLLSTSVAMLPAAWVVDKLTEAGLAPAHALRWNSVLLSYVVGSVPLSAAARSTAAVHRADRLPPQVEHAAEGAEIDFEQHFHWGFDRYIELLRSDAAARRDADTTEEL